MRQNNSTLIYGKLGIVK